MTSLLWKGMAIAVSAVALGGLAVAAMWPRADVTPPPRVATLRAPDRIIVVIDTSASMRGYFTGKTEFKDTLATLIATLAQVRVDAPAASSPAAPSSQPVRAANGTRSAADRTTPSTRRTPQVSYYFTPEAGSPLAPVDGDSTLLIRRILDGGVTFVKSSMLQDAIGRMRDMLKQDPGAVGVLITDGVLSFSNEQIARNTEITRENIGILAAEIQTALHPDRWTSDVHLSVLQYVSSFNGVYYTYRNAPIKLQDRPRPYYVWLLGHQDRVRFLVRLLREQPAPLRPDHELEIPQRAAPNPRVLGYSGRAGTWFRHATHRLTLTDVTITARKAATFYVALDLSHLPPDTASLASLGRQLKVDTEFVEARVTPRASVKPHPRDVAELVGATHYLEVVATNFSGKDGRIRVTLPDLFPDWCAAASIADDREAATEPMPRTFGLLPMLTGAAGALRPVDRPVFTFDIRLES